MEMEMKARITRRNTAYVSIEIYSSKIHLFLDRERWMNACIG